MSTQSLRSDQSGEDDHSAAGEVDSGGMMSDPDNNADSPADLEDQEQDYSKYMPWIKVGRANTYLEWATNLTHVCVHL